MSDRARKARQRASTADLVLSVVETPRYVWLLLSCPYARPRPIAQIANPELHVAAEALEGLGFLEREPTATIPIWRCTEKGEEVAHALLTFFGTKRV